MPTLSVVDVALALTCVESALFGIFFVLAVTSLVVLVFRHGMGFDRMAARPTRVSFAEIVRSPSVIATIMLLATVSAVSLEVICTMPLGRDVAWFGW